MEKLTLKRKTKIFRRDPLPNPLFSEIPEEWDGKHDKVRIELTEKKNYSEELQDLGPTDKEIVKTYRNELKSGNLYEDGPSGGDTHCLGDFSNKGKHWMSKEINIFDRLNYIIYPPILNEKDREVIIPVKIQSLLGHIGPGQKEYSK